MFIPQTKPKKEQKSVIRLFIDFDAGLCRSLLQYLCESDKILFWVEAFRGEETSVAAIVHFEWLLITIIFEDMVQVDQRIRVKRRDQL
jgi:hypothetical protein